jgi:MYXO-CTERM domain-containing protein
VRRSLHAALAAATLCACGPDPAGVVLGPGHASLVRPDTPGNGLMFAFDAGDVVETSGSTGSQFLVHYTRQGPNAVPDADADASGVPDFVEQVGEVYDEVLAHYVALGFEQPLSDEAIADNGGDGRFDVYLVDFAGVGDGHYTNDACMDQRCAGYMVQENDYAGYGYPSTLVANRILGSHEFFHAVQAAYDIEQGSIFAEGTAVWATESFDPSLDDFEYFLDGYLKNCDRSLDVPLPGPVDPFSYGSAIWFQFLEERIGVGTVLDLCQRTVNGGSGGEDPDWYEQLDPALESAGTSFADAFLEFATYNLMTGKYADPARSYANGSNYPLVKIEDVALPYADEELRVFHSSTQYYEAPPAGRGAVTAALVAPAEDPTATQGVTLLLASRTTSDFGPILIVADATAGVETVDAAGADAVVVAVVNGARTGDSKKPALCFGAPDEVSACVASFGGGTGGAGGAGGASATTGAGAASPDAPPSDDDSGCGCRVGDRGSPSAPGGIAALLAGCAYLRLRRRRAARAKSA